MGVASNTRAINKQNEKYSLENVSTDSISIVNSAWEIRHEKCRMDSVGSRRILVNTTVNLLVTLICGELPAQLSSHQRLKEHTVSWSNLVRNSLSLPLSVLLLSYFQLMRGLGWNSRANVWFHIIKRTDFSFNYSHTDTHIFYLLITNYADCFSIYKIRC